MSHETLRITISGNRRSGKTVLAAKIGEMLFNMGADVVHEGYGGMIDSKSTHVNYRNHTIIIEEE